MGQSVGHCLDCGSSLPAGGPRYARCDECKRLGQVVLELLRPESEDEYQIRRAAEREEKIRAKWCDERGRRGGW